MSRVARSQRRGAPLALLLLALGACGGGGGGPAVPGRSPGLISAAELGAESIAPLSLYDAIERLRPTWMRRRAPTGLATAAATSPFPAVLIGAQVNQDIEVLRSLRASDVTQVRFINAGDATTRYGTGLGNGLIEVTVKTGARGG